MKRPLLVLCLAWIVGILSAQLPNGALLPLFGMIGLGLLTGWFLKGNDWGRSGNQVVLILLTVVLGFTRFSLSTAQYEKQIAPKVHQAHKPSLQTDRTWLRGVLCAEYQQTHPDHWRAKLQQAIRWDQTHWQAIPGLVEIQSVTTTQPRGQAGDWLELFGTWKSIESSARPGEPDWRWIHLRTGTSGLFYSTQAPLNLVSPYDTSFRTWLIRLRDNWRKELRDWLLKAPHSSPQGGALALALTSGDQGYLDKNVRTDLLHSGLAHLTAISGLNVSVVLVTLPLLFKLVGVKRAWRAWIGIPMALVLLCLVGGYVSVLRATWMGIALMIAIALDRPADSLNLLAGSALSILVVVPTELFSPGFLMSYMTVLVLVIGTQRLGTWKHQGAVFLQRWFSPQRFLLMGSYHLLFWIISGIWISLLATLAVAPISAYFFHTIAWKGILGNLCAVPLAEGITILGVLGAFGMKFIPVLSTLALSGISVLSHWLLMTIDWVASWETGLSYVLSPSIGKMALLVGILFCLIVPSTWFQSSWSKWRYPRTICALGLITLMTLYPLISGIFGVSQTAPAFQITFLDVGQGDACLIRFRHGETILVDTGPEFRSSPGQLSPLVNMLLSLGVKRLDAFILTHPEIDHIGGVPSILDSFEVGRILASGDLNPTDGFRQINRVLHETVVPTEPIVAGKRVEGIRDATITVLSPQAVDLHSQVGTRNERSLVLRIEQDGLRLLLTSDISADVERDLVEDRVNLKAEILKVAHHGSKNSSHPDFLKAVAPRIAIIQCGRNTFGHPALETIHRLQELGTTIFTTQDDGCIRIVWQNSELKVSTWR